MSRKKGMSRREAVKLAAAAAAFGSALGIGATAEAASGAGRASLKLERMYFKVYRENSLISSSPLAGGVAEEVMNENKLKLKFYRNTKLVNGGQYFTWEG
jgi:hypothetical protein